MEVLTLKIEYTRFIRHESLINDRYEFELDEPLDSEGEFSLFAVIVNKPTNKLAVHDANHNDYYINENLTHLFDEQQLRDAIKQLDELTDLERESRDATTYFLQFLIHDIESDGDIYA